MNSHENVTFNELIKMQETQQKAGGVEQAD